MKNILLKNQYHWFLKNNKKIFLIILTIIFLFSYTQNWLIFFIIFSIFLSIFFCFWFIKFWIIILLNFIYFLIIVIYFFSYKIINNFPIFLVLKTNSEYSILTNGFVKVAISNNLINYNLSIGEVLNVVGDVVKIQKNPNFWAFCWNNNHLNQNIYWHFKNVSSINLIYQGVQYRFWQQLMYGSNVIKFCFFKEKFKFESIKLLEDLSLNFLIKFNAFFIVILYLFFIKLFKKINQIKVFIFWFFWIEIFYFSYLYFFDLNSIKVIIIFYIFAPIIKKWRIKNNWNKIFIYTIFISIKQPNYIFSVYYLYSVIPWIFYFQLNKYENWKSLILKLIWFLILFLPLNIYQNYNIHIFNSLFLLILSPFIFLIHILCIFNLVWIKLNIFDWIFIILNNILFLFKYVDIKIYFRCIGIIYILFYYFIVLIVYRFKFKLANNLIFVFIICVFVNLSILEISTKIINNKKEITILNIGDSNCFLYEDKNKLNLINIGFNENCSKKDIVNFIQYKGYRYIDNIYIQNEYSRNSNALKYIKEKLKIKNLYEFNDMWDSKFEIIANFDKKKDKSFKYIIIREHQKIILVCPDLTIENLEILICKLNIKEKINLLIYSSNNIDNVKKIINKKLNVEKQIYNQSNISYNIKTSQIKNIKKIVY